MAKRIVSGIFVLTALGALGVILAGALTSGEQLIVRFLTAVTVAALGLYVISDLRMQGEEADAGQHPKRGTNRVDQAADAPDAAIAYMATVTGRQRPVPSPPIDLVDPARPTFEPAESVTRQAPADDQHEVGAAPLHPAAVQPVSPGPLARALPPHPNTVLSRTVPASEAPTEPFASHLAETAPLPALDPVDADPTTASEPFEPVSLEPLSYSGPLVSSDDDWPPRPDTDAVDSSAINQVDGDMLSDLAFGTAETDGVHTQDLPLDLTTVGFDQADEIDEEYGPVTVDELLGQLETDLSAPEPQITADKRPHLTLVGSESIDPDSASRQIDAAQYAEPLKAELIDIGTNEIDVTTHPIPASHPSNSPASDDRLNTAIRSGELQVVKTLIEQGMLSTAGPITDRDVRTMVYVAFTSNELRKLIRSGGTPDRVRSGDVDLGPVELFDETRYAPLPTRVYDPTSPRQSLQTATVEGTDTTIDLDPDINLLSPEDEHGKEERLLPPLPTPKHIYRKPGADIGAEK